MSEKEEAKHSESRDKKVSNKLVWPWVIAIVVVVVIIFVVINNSTSSLPKELNSSEKLTISIAQSGALEIVPGYNEMDKGYCDTLGSIAKSVGGKWFSGGCGSEKYMKFVEADEGSEDGDLLYVSDGTYCATFSTKTYDSGAKMTLLDYTFKPGNCADVRIKFIQH